MPTCRPDNDTIVATLQQILSDPTCPKDENVLVQRIRSAPRTQPLAKLLKEHDIKSIVTAVQQIWSQQHLAKAKNSPVEALMVSTAEQPAADNKSPSHIELNDARVLGKPSCLESSPATQSSTQYMDQQFPYPIQHEIFVRLQRTLECACYRYTARNVPELLEEQGWTCAEAIELSCWSGVMKKHKISVNSTANGAQQHLDNMYNAFIAIRHSTVHRNRLSITTIQCHLTIAEMFIAEHGESEDQRLIADIQELVKNACTCLANIEAAIIRERVKRRAEVYRHVEAEIQQSFDEQLRRARKLPQPISVRSLYDSCRTTGLLFYILVRYWLTWTIGAMAIVSRPKKTDTVKPTEHSVW